MTTSITAPTTTDVEGLTDDVLRGLRLPLAIYTQPQGTGDLERATRARRIIAAALRFNGFSFPQIGRMMGRDHTTVVYYLKRLQPVERTEAEQFALKWAGRRAA